MTVNGTVISTVMTVNGTVITAKCCQYSNDCEWYSDHCKVLPVVITVNVASTLIINFVKITQSTSLHTTDEI